MSHESHTFRFHGFDLPGKASVRVVRGRTFYPQKTSAALVELVSRFRTQWGSRAPLSGPLQVTVVKMSAPPKCAKAGSPRMWSTKKPDLDNGLKLLFDAMTKAGVIEDDRMISAVAACKVIGAPSDGHYLGVHLSSVTGDPPGFEFFLQGKQQEQL